MEQLPCRYRRLQGKTEVEPLVTDLLSFGAEVTQMGEVAKKKINKEYKADLVALTTKPIRRSHQLYTHLGCDGVPPTILELNGSRAGDLACVNHVFAGPIGNYSSGIRKENCILIMSIGLGLIPRIQQDQSGNGEHCVGIGGSVLDGTTNL